MARYKKSNDPETVSMFPETVSVQQVCCDLQDQLNSLDVVRARLNTAIRAMDGLSLDLQVIPKYTNSVPFYMDISLVFKL